MNCRKAQQWLSLDMDGELSPSRKARLGEHLMLCPGCRQAREQWVGLRGQFRAREVVQGRTPEALWADVRRGIRTSGAVREPEGLPWGLGIRWAAAVVIAVLFVGAGLITWRRPADSPVASTPPEGGRVEWVETGLPGASPMVYEDIETGLVIIWVVEANHKEPPHAGT